MKTLFRLFVATVMMLSFWACSEKAEVPIIPPAEAPDYYDVTVRTTDHERCTEVSKQDDGSWYIDWHLESQGGPGWDAFVYLDIQLGEEQGAGADFSKFNILEFEVKGATEIEKTPLILFLGGLAWPANCSDCKNFIPISDDWVKVTCYLKDDGADALAPWTWIRMGIGANAHTPSFYIRNIRLRQYDEDLDGPVVIPPVENPEHYEVEIRDEGYEHLTGITKQDDGSWYVDWHLAEDHSTGFDAFFYLDIKETVGVDFEKYNVLEFKVKGTSEVETSLIIALGGFGGGNVSDCVNKLPVSEDWVSVTCKFKKEGCTPVKPWTWMRVGVGALPHTPTFYIKDIILRPYDPAVDDEPVVTPPDDAPAYYDVEIRDKDYEHITKLEKQADGSWYIDWHNPGDNSTGFDAFFFLDIKLAEGQMAEGANYAFYNTLEFEVKGANVESPLSFYLGGLAFPYNCSDFKNSIPVSDDWVKVICKFKDDGANATAPWTWMRVGVGDKVHSDEFFIRNIRLLKSEN